MPAGKHEDLRIIQAQQRIIDAHPGPRMGVIAADRGLVLFRGVMKRLIANETLPAPRIHRPVR
jgi:hypothetical protein